VTGGDIVSGAEGAFRKARFYSCPVAEATDTRSWTHAAVDLCRRSRQGDRLTSLVDKPSAMAWEAVELLAAEVERIREVQRNIRRKQEGR